MEVEQSENESRAFEKRIDETLSRKNKTFMRVFFVTVIFSLTVFFFILLPYVTSHTARTELLREVVKLEEDRDDTDTGILYHTEVAEWLKKAIAQAHQDHREMVEWEYHNHLESVKLVEQLEKIAQAKRRFAEIPGAQKWIAGEALRPEESVYKTMRAFSSSLTDACYWLENDMWINCSLATELGRRHQKIRRQIKRIDSTKLQDFNTTEMTKQLDNLYAPFDKWVSEPKGGHTQDRNRQSVSFFWRDYIDLLVLAEKKIKKNLNSLEVEKQNYVDTVKMKQTDIMQSETKLKSVRRLNKIDTPMGSLPIGLDDLILAFPVALALLLYYAIELLNDVIILRKALHLRYQERSSPPREGAKEYLSMTSPLWLDPLDSPAQSSVKILSVILLLLVFLMSLWLIIDQDFFFNNEVVSGWTTRSVILGLYIYSGYIIINTLRRLTRSIKDYRRNVYIK